MDATVEHAVSEWEQAQQRVVELVGSLPPDQAERVVPACPGWTVRQLLAHMVGLDADVVAGDEPDDHNSTWTQAQVDARADDDLATIVTEWQGLTAAVAAWMRANSTRPLGDVVIHEQDLRGALDAPGAEDNPGLLAIRDRMAGGFDTAVRDAGLPAIALTGPTWTFVAGDGEPAVELQASDFDLTRALLARRSAAQLRSWTVSGDVEPYLAAFAGLGPLPDDDLSI